MTPKIIFIVPYRDRPIHKHFFENYMKYILEDYPDGYCEVFFSEQNSENKYFNRGAVKNIGFLAMKQRYPDHYEDITFVFNDVDTVPYKKGLLPYETTRGVIKHFFGFTFALGGIFSITGADFEKIKGFPNYWTWGHEDAVIQRRALQENMNISIDRSVFFSIRNPSIIQLNNHSTRNMDVGTSFALSDWLNTIDIIMNLRLTINKDTNTIFIDNFDLALTKNIHSFTLNLTKGRNKYMLDVARNKKLYKMNFGENVEYKINENITGAKEHLLKLNYNLNDLNYNDKLENRIQKKSVIDVNKNPNQIQKEDLKTNVNPNLNSNTNSLLNAKILEYNRVLYTRRRNFRFKR